jgi:TonB family protein
MKQALKNVDKNNRAAQLGILLAMGCAFLFLTPLFAFAGADTQVQEVRKILTSAPPEYPELARKLKIEGLARVLITVTPKGTVSDVKELGGNPILLQALVRSVKQTTYEPGNKESVIEIKYHFKLRE